MPPFTHDLLLSSSQACFPEPVVRPFHESHPLARDGRIEEASGPSHPPGDHQSGETHPSAAGTGRAPAAGGAEENAKGGRTRLEVVGGTAAAGAQQLSRSTAHRVPQTRRGPPTTLLFLQGPRFAFVGVGDAAVGRPSPLSDCRLRPQSRAWAWGRGTPCLRFSFALVPVSPVVSAREGSSRILHRRHSCGRDLNKINTKVYRAQEPQAEQRPRSGSALDVSGETSRFRSGPGGIEEP